MNNKKLSFVASIIAVVIVVVVIVIVEKQKTNIGDVSTHSTSRAITTLCENIDNKKLCNDVLRPIKTSDPKDYVSMVVKTSMDSVVKALNMSKRLIVENANNNNNHLGIKMALEDCNDLLQSAIDELETTLVFVQETTSIQDIIGERHVELMNWLGAIVAYKQSCLDGFNITDNAEKHVRSHLQTGSLDNIGKLIGLALDVMSELSNLNILKPASSHRLLEVDHEGYPTWFSAADRKLLYQVGAQHVQPNAIVAKDGSGKFMTVKDAINSYPKNNQGRFIIYVKAGIYDEYITIDKEKPNIILYGDGPTKTIITGSKNINQGLKTMRTATLSVEANNFIAKSIAIENTAGPESGQAVALRVQGDQAAIFDCAMHGYQDTLYVHAHRQFYRDCTISGTMDFIFGHSTTLIQNSKIIVRKPAPKQHINVVVADGRLKAKALTGIVLQNCEIMPAPEFFADRLTVKTYLARPWKEFSRAVFIENIIGDLIQPEGYIPFSPTEPNTQNSYFAEFGNTGPGANTQARAKWGKGLISKDEAAIFTAQPWLHAGYWLPSTGIPFDVGFTKH